MKADKKGFSDKMAHTILRPKVIFENIKRCTGS